MEAQALVVANQQTAVSRYDQQEIVATIKQTVCKGATDAQLRMFLEVCKRTGLDPFLKEIWFVAEKGIIMAGRDGYLRVANENPAFDGMETRVERDSKNMPVKAVCTVWRKDRNHPVVCEAYFSEYRKGSPVWTQYPSAMIQKVAEVLALKRSFAINGVVTEEEIGNDGRGSVEAAQAVATAKIEAAKEGKVYEPPPEVIDAELADEPPPADDMHLGADATERSAAGRRAASKFDVLKAFRELKTRYQKIGQEPSYYAVLGRYGMEKSSQFPDSEEGRRQARACYKEMSLDVADLEAYVARVKD